MNYLFSLIFLLSFSSHASSVGLGQLISSEIEKELVRYHKMEKGWYKKSSLPNKEIKKDKLLLANSKSKKTIVNKALRTKTKKGSNWQDQYLEKTDNWGKQKNNRLEKWQAEKRKIVNRWMGKKEKFLKNIDLYRKNSVLLPVVEEEKKKDPKSKKIKQILSSGRKKIIPHAFYRPALDQGPRSTCVAFASIRGIEILLAQKAQATNLSEQYFYYASKPNCQQRACSEAGSWAINGLIHARTKGIPNEQYCPYQKRATPNNETQLPLPATCSSPVARVEGFSKIKSTHDLLKAIDRGHPVIAGMRLSENFYKNKGFVPHLRNNALGNDKHAQGHAVLIVGYYKLPAQGSSSQNQGRYCFVAANSWGEGWGVGGHACLTERWLDHYRYRTPMIELTGASLL